MKKRLKIIDILEFITISIYIISINYYSNEIVNSGFIRKNYIYLIVFSIVTLGGVFLLDRLFNKISKKM